MYATPAEHLRVNFVSSADGAVTLEGVSGGLSGPADKRLFHLMRDMADVVLVAAGTIRNEGYGYPDFGPERRARRLAAGLAELPHFAIVSRSLELDLSSSLFIQAPVRTLVFAAAEAPDDRRAELAKHAEVVASDGLPRPYGRCASGAWAGSSARAARPCSPGWSPTGCWTSCA